MAQGKGTVVKLEERPYHHGDLRNELIRIGLELIGEGGTAAVGIRESARRVGVSASAAYRHFDSRDDLLNAVRDRVLQNLGAHIEEALEGHEADDVGTRIEIASCAYFDFAVLDPRQFQALASAFPLADDWETSSGRPLKIVVGLISEIDPPVDDVVTTALSTWAVAHGASCLTTIGSLKHFPIERKWDLLNRTIELHLKGLNLR